MSPRPVDRVIVAGLGRCGSSLTMQMLAAGGMECHGTFPAYEVDRTEAGSLTAAWLKQQRGAIKVLDIHRHPIEALELHGNAILWLDRDTAEQARSQAKFLRHIAERQVNRKQMRGLGKSIEADTITCHRILSRLNVPVLRMTFEELIRTPHESARHIASWLRPLGVRLHVTRMGYTPAMRPTHCLPGFLETSLMEIGGRMPLRAEA